MTTQKFTIHTKLNNADVILHPKTEVSQVEGFTQSVNGLISTAVSNKANATHSHVGTEVTLTGYSKASSASAVAATDTANAAIGKIEKGLDGKVGTSDTITSSTIASNWSGLSPAQAEQYVTYDEMEDYVAAEIAKILSGDEISY